MKRVWMLVPLLLWSLPLAAQEGAERPTVGAAGRLRAQGLVDEATRMYEAVERDAKDDNERAQAALGLAQIHQGRDRAKAADDYRRITALAGANAAYRQSAWRQIAMLVRDTDPAAAREALGHLLTDFPNDPEGHVAATLEIAMLDVSEGDAAQAIPVLHKLLQTAEKSPRLPEVYMVLTQAQGEAGDFAGAAATARAGLKRFPDRRDLMVNLAALYEQRGKLSEAAAVVQELLQQHPEEHDLLRSLYDLRQQEKKVPQLAAWLEQRAQADPFDLIWLGHLARVCEWENDTAGTLRARALLVGRRPTDARLLQDAAQAAVNAKAFEQAAKWLEQARALEPDNQALVALAGEVALQQGQPQQALAIWKQGLKYEPKNRQTVLNLGNLLSRHDLYQEAATVYTEARAAGGDPASYALNLAQVYEDLANVPGAVREYALALRPGSRDSGMAVNRLNRLAEDDLLRAEVVAALEKLSQEGALPADAATALVYGKILSGGDPAEALQSLAPDKPQAVTMLLARLAGRLEGAGRPQVAITCYQRLLQEPLAPDYAAAIALRLSELYLQQGDWRAALAGLAPLKLDTLQMDLGAQVALERGELLLRRARQPAEALHEYNLVLELQPAGPLAVKARWGEADVAFALGKHDLALAAYQSLLRQDSDASVLAIPDLNNLQGPQRRRRLVLPGADYVQFQTAEALFRQSKDTEAAAAFGKFAAANAASPYANDALERVVLLQKLKGKPTGAAEYREALILAARGEVGPATTLLEGITTPPLADAALLLLGEVRLWEGKTAEALATLDRLVAEQSESLLAPEARYLAAMALVRSDQPAAQRRLEALVAASPEAPQSEQAKVVLENWRRLEARR